MTDDLYKDLGRLVIFNFDELMTLAKDYGYVDDWSDLEHTFVMEGVISNAMWTMWKIVLSGQVTGKWSVTSSSLNGHKITFYFENEHEAIYSRLIAHNDDRPEDGYVPNEMIMDCPHA